MVFCNLLMRLISLPRSATTKLSGDVFLIFLDVIEIFKTTVYVFKLFQCYLSIV